MPKERLPSHGNKEIEFTQAELEKFFKVKLAPGLSLQYFFTGLNIPEPCRFLITKDFDIFLDFDFHDTIKRKIGKDENDCMIRGGYFIINYLSSQPEFIYYEDSAILATKEGPTRKAMENKIKAFLVENKFKVE